MIKSLFKKSNHNGNGNGNPASGPSSSHARTTAEQKGMHLENYFHAMLEIERKRVGRSRKPFLMMLLHIDNVFTPAEKDDAVEKIIPLLFSLTRETDIKGWYEQGEIMGIIFTEMNNMDTYLLREKIRDNLLDALDAEKAGSIKISLHHFPEKHDDEESSGSADMTLYTDLIRKKGKKRTSLITKRVIDICGSLMGILLFSPFFLIVPILIKLTSKGPVFFRQTRVGQYGKRFTFLKFRSMQTNCDENIHREYIKKLIQEKSSYSGGNGNNGNGKGDPSPVYKICDDPRISPIGNFLRKTSLDELPQFFNVLMGEMSLVGPRPPIPYEIENYDIWHRRRLHEVKPGITGLWQVKGRSSTNFDEMVRLDLQYSRQWSIWLDLKIIFETPIVLFMGKGGY